VALVDPVKIYAAKSNVQAQLICRLLQQASIDAFAGEDFSPAGVWMGGTLPGVFDAAVWVGRADAERAAQVIREHERVESERSAAEGPEVWVTCEECGKTFAFPAAQQGTVQDCPHCGAYVDVEADGLPDEWTEEDEGAAEE